MPTKTTVIEKPKKVLREGLQNRISALEAKGWKISVSEKSNYAQKAGEIFGGSFTSITRLILLIEEKEELKEHMIANYFHSYEIKDALKLPENEAIEYLCSNAKESIRGSAGEWGQLATKSGGNIDIWKDEENKHTFKIKDIAAEVLTRNRSKSKAKAKSKQPEPTVKETSDQSPLETEQIIFIAVDDIEESPLEPQKLRRQTFTEDSLRELGNSIIHEKQIEPAVVRFNSESGKYQLVVGERRWRAIKLVGEPLVGGKPSLKCVVMELTDEQCLRVQYQENHQRQNNDPILDAFYFKHLVETENYTVTDLAERFGIDRKTARQTLLLNDLIEDVKLQVIKGILPKKHACYIASFPEVTQREIAERKFAFRDFNLEKRAVPYEQFENIVEDNIARRLKDAPFDTEDERLHVTGLKCSDCRANTLNQGELFAGQFGSDAVCLDGECFNLKTSTDRRLKQIRIAEEKAEAEEITVEEALETVPLVTEKPVVLDEKLKDKVLTDQEIFGEKECAYSVAAVAVDGVHKNKQVWVCRNDDCEIHHPKPKAEELSESQRVGRKREFYMKVGNEVRMKILGEAMDYFDDYTPFWQFDDLIRELLVNVLNSIHYSEQIKVLTKHWKNPLKFDSPETISKFVDKLDKRQISQLLFLVTKATQIKSRYDESPLRIETIKKLTADYTKLDYLLLEAETIAKLAPDEFKPEAEEYLSSVRHGIVPPKKPKFWTELQEDANR